MLDFINVKVKPLESPRTGEPVKNQYDILNYSDSSCVFQSYDTPIAMLKSDDTLIVNDMAFYSVTTARYFKVWCNKHYIKMDCIAQCKKAFQAGNKSVKIVNAVE